MVQIVWSNKVWPAWNCYSKYMPGNSSKVFSSDRSIQKLEASSIGRRRKIPICISWNPKNWGAWNVYYGKFNCRVSRHNILVNELKEYISIIIILTLQKFIHVIIFSPSVLESHNPLLEIPKKLIFRSENSATEFTTLHINLKSQLPYRRQNSKFLLIMTPKCHKISCCGSFCLSSFSFTKIAFGQCCVT